VCSDAPPSPGVSVLGRVSESELAERYGRAWVFCLPSSYEGFGVPYIEALSSGTAVVATPNPGANEVLESGRLGIITQPERLGPTLVALLNDPARRASLEATGRDHARRYDWSAIAAQYEQVFEDTLRTAGRGT